MNLQIFRYPKLLAKVNKNLADELSQPRSFPSGFSTNRSSTARSNKKAQKPAGSGFLKFFWTLSGFHACVNW